MKTLIISATQQSDYKNTLLFKSIESLLSHGVVIDYKFATENKEGLGVVYNRALESAKEHYECVIFAHDDAYIDDAYLVDKLRDGFERYDIIGIAGGLDPAIKAPALWHLMCSREKLHGVVGTFNERQDHVGYTSFGYVPARVAILDGVFLAVNLTSIKTTSWKFNENYAFHHYDLASCIDANTQKLKCGVVPIYIIHQSPGLLDINDASFQKSQSIFLAEYGS